MTSLVCVPPDEVWKIWPGRVHELVDSAFARADVPMPDDIAEQLKYGTRLLWLVIDKDQILAALLTQLFPMRSGLVLKLLEGGGEKMSNWLHLKSQIEDYAKREGCVRVIVEGRPGWARVLPDYEVVGVTLEKRI